MHKKSSKRKREMTARNKNIIGIIVSLLAGFIITISISLICALALYKSENLPDSLMLYLTGSVLLGALISGFTASKKCAFKGIVSGLISSVPFVSLNIVLMLIFSKGRLAYESVFLIAGIIICSAIGGIFGANTKRRR